MPNERVLELTSVEAGYNLLQVLWGVSLHVDEGELVALLGPNGAGKTTTLRTIAGYLKPLGGGITFRSKAIGGAPAHAVSRLGLGYVSESLNLFPAMSVRENLQVGANAIRNKAHVDATMDLVFQLFPRLLERRDQLAGTLSGGERKMLAIGRGLMGAPSLLLVDEPSLGLAPMATIATFEALKALRERGVTILLVEQNVNTTLRLVDRAYVLEQGRIVLEGTGEQLLATPTSRLRTWASEADMTTATNLRSVPLQRRYLTFTWLTLAAAAAIMVFEVFAQPTIVVNTLVTRGMWALMAAGLAMVFGVMNIPNFAHGELFLLGSFTAFTVYAPIQDVLRNDPSLTWLKAFNRSRHDGRDRGRRGHRRAPRGRAIPAAAATEPRPVGHEHVPTDSGRLGRRHQRLPTRDRQRLPRRAGVLDPPPNQGPACPSRSTGDGPRHRDRHLALFALFLRRTRLGRAIRAVSQDETGAQMAGIDLNGIFVLTMAISCALAALAGASLLFLFPAYPDVGLQPLYTRVVRRHPGGSRATSRARWSARS